MGSAGGAGVDSTQFSGFEGLFAASSTYKLQKRSETNMKDFELKTFYDRGNNDPDAYGAVFVDAMTNSYIKY